MSERCHDWALLFRSQPFHRALAKYSRFPDYGGELPQVPKGIRIIQPDEDLGPASKVLFAAEDLRGTDTDIIYCDDDNSFAADRFERMMGARDGKENRCVTVCGGDLKTWGCPQKHARQPRATLWKKGLDYRIKRMHQMARQITTGVRQPKPKRVVFTTSGYVDIAMGYGAVLVRPDFFDAAAYDIPPVLWAVDDIWLSGHMIRNGKSIWLTTDAPYPEPDEAGELDPLLYSTIDGASRRDADLACIRYMQTTYGIWR